MSTKEGEMVTATREGRERARLTPPRPVKYNLSLTAQERDELDRRALAAGYSSAAEFLRRQIIGGEPRSAAC